MAVWMAVMLTVSVSGVYDAVALGLFAVGTGWATIRLAAARGWVAYLRLCICCGGMVVMLLPAATVAASSAEAMSRMPGMPWMPEMPPMPGMPGMPAGRAPMTAPVGVPDVVTVLLVAALLVVAASQASAMRHRRDADRWARRLEISTATTMALMLGLAL
jgi:hypothetical protein